MQHRSKFKRTLIGAGVAAALASSTALAVDPYAKMDQSWISISGTVVTPTADDFILDYGKGIITVEMDDWDDYGDAYGLMDGDKVTVYGAIDDDLFEIATIEASAVYVENLNTYFYASSADEEGIEYPSVSYWNHAPLSLHSLVTVSGTVTSVDSDDRKFTVDTGRSMLTVETDAMAYNPLDDLGYQQIDAGDIVSVTGNIDYEFFDGRVLEARSVTTMLDNNRDA